jgi:tRNA 2-selenouridine synthase
MYKTITIKPFLEKSRAIPVLDVRTNEEYEQGHIPGAINFLLFEADERAIIGKTYNEEGSRAAILKGLELSAGKTGRFIRSGRSIAQNQNLLVHCWRGGFRSASLAWLFETAGIRCYVLKGGYKAYRRHVLNGFRRPVKLIVLGGMTGSGKTDILHHLRDNGFQVLDLEGLAHHKGSAFGALGEMNQNSNEQFENEISGFLFKCNPEEPVWIEDESRNIGRNLIPSGLYRQILTSPLILIEADTGIRISRLVRDYSGFPSGLLESSIKKLSKRLGGLIARSALEYLEKGDFRKVAGLMLDYYDKTYSYSLKARDPRTVHPVKISSHDPETAADRVIKRAASLSLIRH